MKIVQNIQKALSGISSGYITDEQEFNWTKKLLEENKCDTDRVIKQVETQITCKFCIIAIENQTDYLKHLKDHQIEMRKHFSYGLKKLGEDSEKNGITCLICPVEEVFKHYVMPREVSLSVKKKTSEERPNQLNGKIAETVVYKCLKNHQKQGVRQLALELQKEVPILQNEKVPSFQDLL